MLIKPNTIKNKLFDSFIVLLKGIGTDENRLIKEIVTHSNGARQLIKEKYLTMYGKKLEEDIKSEIKGNFLTGVLALLGKFELIYFFE